MFSDAEHAIMFACLFRVFASALALLVIAAEGRLTESEVAAIFADFFFPSHKVWDIDI